ncbi:MAG: SCO6745 family protein [Acidimicrobiales bacterium]
MATDRDAAYHDAARRMRDLVEPLAAAVYFAPEAQQRYEALGLNYVEAYFGSRSACLGTVPWRVVSGVFAAFKPSVVERAMAGVHAKTDPQALLEARLAGARDQIVRMAGAPTDDFLVAADLLLEVTDGLDGSGRALYSALAGLPVPGRDDPAGRLWRAADLVREHRGDGHIAAWLPHFDSAEVTVLTEPWWGIEPGSYAWTRGWDADDIASARARLVDRGLLDDEAGITEAGRALREQVEDTTDLAAREVIVRLGDRIGELFTMLDPLSKAMLGQDGYPVRRSELFG